MDGYSQYVINYYFDNLVEDYGKIEERIDGSVLFRESCCFHCILLFTFMSHSFWKAFLVDLSVSSTNPDSLNQKHTRHTHS